MATRFIAETSPVEEVAHSGQSFVAARSFPEEPRTNEATIDVDVSIGETGEERPTRASAIDEEPAASGANITMADPQK